MREARGTAQGDLEPVNISVVIPTYRREGTLLSALGHLLDLRPSASELLVVDQTEEHEPRTIETLSRWHESGAIRWIRLPAPSVTHAMNAGLLSARREVVLFLDDDIIPGPNLIAAHVRAHEGSGFHVVAGQVLQPGEVPLPPQAEPVPFRFCSSRRTTVTEVMGGNFSVNRHLALSLGGFDENFVQAAYRFEAEFCERVLTAGEKILFEPEASIRHLQDPNGGVRSYGNHLRTARPGHSVGAYYHILRSRPPRRRGLEILRRLFRAVRTRHHLTHPWWIPPTLVAELSGMVRAMRLAVRGPRLLTGEGRATVRKS